jgi:hypothetical protein
VGLTTLHHKNNFVMNILNEPRAWLDSLDKQPKRRNMDEIRIMECKEFAQGGLPNDSLEGTSQIYVRFSGGAGQMGGRWHQTYWRIYIFLQKGE